MNPKIKRIKQLSDKINMIKQLSDKIKHIKVIVGKVVAYGIMPNTNQIGWYFVCYEDEIDDYIKRLIG